MLRVELLGELRLEAEGEPLAPPDGRRARELLAWLALNPGPHGRSQLAARLWPDVLDSSARASLRTALHELRRSLGERGARYLRAGRSDVELQGDGVWVDVLEFRRLAAAGEAEAALALCRGEPLRGLDEDWVLALRDEHREHVDAVYEQLAAEAQARGELPAALRWTRERAKVAPLSEEAARALMRRLAAAGDRPAALTAYARLEARLRTQLAVAPSSQTRELASRLRTETEEDPGSTRERPRLPPALRRRERTGLLGRRAELERLRATVQSSAHGELRLALVSGEPGIGKTRLLAELCRWAHAQGATVLHGRCYEQQVGPYQPFAEALGWYAVQSAPERIAAGADAAELARLVPGLGAEPGTPASDSDSGRWRLFEEVAAVLARAGDGAPVLLAIDDLHWADTASLLLLAHLVRNPRPAPLALAGSYRESELGRGHKLVAALADLRREGLVERVALHGLDRGEVGELVAAWLGPESPPELAAAVYEETGGNPFFAGEILRHLAESGEIRRHEGRWTPERRISEMGIPAGVKEAIGRRLERLSEPCGRVLAAASVAGRDFDVAVLERLETLAEVDVLAALEQAEAAAMVREDPARPCRYGFTHPLIRETLYGELGLTRRVRLHGALAEALEAAHGSDREHLADIAHHHLEAAAAGDPAVTVDWALRAAAAAAQSLAHEEGAALLERALGALDGSDPRRECELRLALGEALLRAGDQAAAGESFDAAAGLSRRLSAPELLARAALGRSGLGVSIIAVDEGAVELLREALAAGGVPDALRARLLGRLAIETYYAAAPQERKRMGDEAVAVARRAGDETALLDALNARHAALWSPAYLDERLATARELIEAAERIGDDERALQGRNWLVLDLAELGDLRSMEAEVERHHELAERLRLPAYTWWGPLWRSTLAAIEGRYRDAELLITEVAEIGRRTGDANARLYADIQGDAMSFTRERWGDIPDHRLERELGRPAEAAYRSGFAWVCAARGDLEAARGHLEWLMQGGLRLPDDMNRLAALCEMSQALELLGDVSAAPVVSEALLPYRDRNVVNGRAAVGYGAVAHHLGVLATLMGRDAEAEAHLRRALELHETMRARPWLARTRLAYAELLLRQGDRARARDFASRAQHAAEALGLERLAERAARLGAA